jgi:hypothetical protein
MTFAAPRLAPQYLVVVVCPECLSIAAAHRGGGLEAWMALFSMCGLRACTGTDFDAAELN